MPAGTQTTKKQHYVPQHYLRRFADKKEKLFVFDKTEQRVYRAGVRDVAQDNYFYDIPIEALEPGTFADDFDPQMVEKEFSRIETQFKVHVEALLKDVETKGITPEQRFAMSFFLMMQLLRTQEFRTKMVQAYTAMGEALAQIVLEATPDIPADTKAWPVFSAGQEAAHHASFMFDKEVHDAILPILFSHIWIIGINNTRTPLYTSDNAAAKQAHIRSPLMSYDGVGAEGIEILFPLTPKHILILREPSYHKGSRPHDGKTIELTTDSVTYLNSVQVFRSYRQIFSSSDDFSLARTICKETPQITDRTRGRIQVLNGRRVIHPR